MVGGGRFRKGVTLLLLSLYKQSQLARAKRERALFRFTSAARDIRMVGFVSQNKLGKHNPLPTPSSRYPIRSSSRAHASFFYHRRPSGKKLSRDFHSLRPANAAVFSLSLCAPACPAGMWVRLAPINPLARHEISCFFLII